MVAGMMSVTRRGLASSLLFTFPPLGSLLLVYSITSASLPQDLSRTTCLGALFMFLQLAGGDKSGDKEISKEGAENQKEGEEEGNRIQLGSQKKRRIRMRMEREHEVPVEGEEILKEAEE